MEARQYATYEDMLNTPEGVTAEVIHGQLHTAPLPSPRHAHVQTLLSFELVGPYDKGKGGPGGWIFLDEPELWLSAGAGPKGNYVVPDIAGWKRERFHYDENQNGISVPPDWLCEVISPSSVKHDRITKMALYAEFKIPYVWLVDPDARILEAFALQEGKWVIAASFAESDSVVAPPFDACPFDLNSLWL